MSKNTKFSESQVLHTAKLANLPLTKPQTHELAGQFSQTLDTIQALQEVGTDSVTPTHHVTGLTNVTRQDKIDTSRVLTQEDALSGTHKTHKGYFVVGALIDNE